MVDVAADRLRGQDQVRPMILDEAGDRGRQRGSDIVLRKDAGEKRLGRLVASMRRLGQRDMHGIADAEHHAGRHVLGAAQGHVVDFGVETLVELASEREPLRIKHRAGEERCRHDAPAVAGHQRQRAAAREHGIVEVRREDEGRPAHNRCGSARKRHGLMGRVGSIGGRGPARTTSA